MSSVLKFHIAIRGELAGAIAPLPATFDHALTALEQLDRLFIEPDGSFVWTGILPDGTSWQVDGNLIDRGDRLAYVELKGHCQETQLNQILETIGWPNAALAFELTRQGSIVTEAAFRRLAATQAGAV